MSSGGNGMKQSDRLAARYEMKRKMTRLAGEVRLIKDKGGDEKQWGWSMTGPSEREMDDTFTFNPKYLEPLARTLRSALIGLGHVQSAYNTFTKIKSAQISPDGNMGGRGYIQRVTDLRRQFMNCSEALSAITDTLYDEINAPHWKPSVGEQDPRERDGVVQIMDDVEDIKKDPEEWAETDEQEDFGDDEGGGEDENASHLSSIQRVASAYLQRRTQ